MYHVLRGEFADFFDGARRALFELHAEYLFEVIMLVGGSWYAGSCVCMVIGVAVFLGSCMSSCFFGDDWIVSLALESSDTYPLVQMNCVLPRDDIVKGATAACALCAGLLRFRGG